MVKKEQMNIRKVIRLIVIVIGIFSVWLVSFLHGASSFNSGNAVEIYVAVLGGMPALLGISISIVIFRIQSLENRLNSLEDSTLDYIFLTSQRAYPEWLPIVENDIRTGEIAERYLNRNELDERKQPSIKENKVSQQRRLMEALTEHESLEQKIKQARLEVIESFSLLLLPILLSFLLLMISDTLSDFFNYVGVSLVILLSICGVFSLILTTIDSIGEFRTWKKPVKPSKK